MKKLLISIVALLGMVSLALANGTVTFSAPMSSSTLASFSAPGTYSLTLTASDGVTTSSRTVQVVALPNVPPVLGPCNANGIGGSGTGLNVQFSSGTTAVAGAQFSLGLPAGVSLTSVVAGAAATAAGKSVSFSSSTTNANIIVFGLNQNPINGGILTSFGIQLAANVPGGNLVLPVSNATFTDASGNAVAGTSQNCGIVVTANQPPSIITITAPTSIILPASASLSGTVTDIDPTRPITYQWSGQ